MNRRSHGDAISTMTDSQLCIFTPYPLEASLLTDVLESEFDLKTLHAHSEEEVIRCARRATMLVIREAGPHLDRLALVRNVLRANPRIVVVVLEGENTLGALAYLQAGTTLYLKQDIAVHDLLVKVRAAQRGEVTLSPDLTARILHRLQELARLSLDDEMEVSRCERLTQREREIARELAAHRSNREIARALDISLGTVKTHVHHVMKKLDVDSRQLVGTYWRIYESRERESG